MARHNTLQAAVVVVTAATCGKDRQRSSNSTWDAGHGHTWAAAQFCSIFGSGFYLFCRFCYCYCFHSRACVKNSTFPRRVLVWVCVYVCVSVCVCGVRAFQLSLRDKTKHAAKVKAKVCSGRRETMLATRHQNNFACYVSYTPAHTQTHNQLTHTGTHTLTSTHI